MQQAKRPKKETISRSNNKNKNKNKSKHQKDRMWLKFRVKSNNKKNIVKARVICHHTHTHNTKSIVWSNSRDTIAAEIDENAEKHNNTATPTCRQ